MLELKNMKVSYDEKEAMQVDSLAFQPGEMTAVLGENGSGKTTLLRALDGQMAYQGSIQVDGKEVKNLPHEERAQLIGYLPQNLLPVQMRVETLVSHGRFPYTGFSHTLTARDREKIEDAMARTDVTSLRNRMVDSLSGGERTRAYLAMVLAQESRYLLLDEPAADLDISHQQLLFQILKELREKQVGIIFSSHDIPLSLSVSQKVCLVKRGNVLDIKKPKDLEEDSQILRQCVGVGVQSVQTPNAIYKYQLIR